MCSMRSIHLLLFAVLFQQHLLDDCRLFNTIVVDAVAVAGVAAVVLLAFSVVVADDDL